MRFFCKSFLFITILVISLVIVSRVFIPKDGELNESYSRAGEFYSLPSDSVDVMFFGASTFLQGITPMQMWRDYGFTSFMRVNGGQAAMVSYYFLVESLKYQSPDVVVIDAASLFGEYDFEDREAKLRNAIDPMRFSLTKLRLIAAIVARDPGQSFASYVFPVLRYHSRWSELINQDLDFNAPEAGINKGFYGFRYGSNVENPPSAVGMAGPTEPFDEDALFYIEQMIHLCIEKNIGVVFLTMPRDDWSAGKHASLQSLADGYGIQYVDYNLAENASAIQLETRDLFDKRHLNTFGAQKVTRHFGAWIQEHYHLPDHRSDPAYAKWNQDLEVYEAAFQRRLQALPQ